MARNRGSTATGGDGGSGGSGTQGGNSSSTLTATNVSSGGATLGIGKQQGMAGGSGGPGASGIDSTRAVFAAAHGNDTVTGFVPGEDVIVLEGYAAAFGTDVAAFLASHLAAGPSGYLLETSLHSGAASSILFRAAFRTPTVTDLVLA